MLKILLPFFLIGLFSSFALAQEGVHWSDPVTVSVDGDKSAVVGNLSDGTPIVVWGKGSLIYFSRKQGNEFSSPINISTTGTTSNIYSFGGLDMATHGDEIYIVFENFNDGIFLIRSLDGGETFDAPINVYNPIPGKWATLSSVAVDDEGNPIVSVIFENTNETEGTFILMASPDGGQTFSDPVVASEPALGEYVCECCPSDIIAKDGNIWLVFRNNDNDLRDMWVTKSSDNGATFSEGVDVDDTDWTIFACPISGPKMAPLAGDSLLTIWLSGASGTGRISISTLNGATMEKGLEAEIPLTNSAGFQSNPVTAGGGDTIGIAWEESGFGNNGIDIMFAMSKNGSDGLLANKMNISVLPGSQKFPSLIYHSGYFHLVYTNGNGGLVYRKGEVAEVSKNQNLFAPVDCWEIIHPISGPLQITTSCPSDFQTVTFQLHDLSGRLVRSWSNSSLDKNWELDVSHESSGIYLFSVLTDSGKSSSQKITLIR